LKSLSSRELSYVLPLRCLADAISALQKYLLWILEQSQNRDLWSAHPLKGAAETAGVLMANHGPIVSGTNFCNAMYAIEELEESAKIALLLHNRDCVEIPADKVNQLLVKYGHRQN